MKDAPRLIQASATSGAKDRAKVFKRRPVSKSSFAAEPHFRDGDPGSVSAEPGASVMGADGGVLLGSGIGQGNAKAFEKRFSAADLGAGHDLKNFHRSDRTSRYPFAPAGKSHGHSTVASLLHRSCGARVESLIADARMTRDGPILKLCFNAGSNRRSAYMRFLGKARKPAECLATLGGKNIGTRHRGPACR